MLHININVHILKGCRIDTLHWRSGRKSWSWGRQKTKKFFVGFGAAGGEGKAFRDAWCFMLLGTLLRRSFIGNQLSFSYFQVHYKRSCSRLTLCLSSVIINRVGRWILFHFNKLISANTLSICNFWLAIDLINFLALNEDILPSICKVGILLKAAVINTIRFSFFNDKVD